MESSIGRILVELISPIVDITLSMSEEMNTPFCTYDLSELPTREKKGIYKWTATVSIWVVGTAFDQIEPLAAAIKTAIEARKNRDFFAKMINQEEQSDGQSQVAYKIDYSITQLL